MKGLRLFSTVFEIRPFLMVMSPLDQLGSPHADGGGSSSTWFPQALEIVSGTHQL